MGPFTVQGVCRLVSTWLNGVYWVRLVAERPDGLVVIEPGRCGQEGDADHQGGGGARPPPIPLLRETTWPGPPPTSG